MSVILYLTLGFIPIFTFAQQKPVSSANTDGLCEELARFTCLAPGPQDDGTGVASNERLSSNRQIDFMRANQALYKAKFREALSNPKNEDLLDTALSGLGLAIAPHCQSTKTADREKCLDDLATGLGDYAMALSLGGTEEDEDSDNLKSPTAPSQRRRNSEVALQNIALLFAHPDFRELTDELIKEVKPQLSNPELAKKVEKEIFPQIQNLIRDEIERTPMDPALKKQLKKKVAAIRWSTIPCSTMSGGNQIRSGLTQNAAYLGNKVFQICDGLLTSNKSIFQLAFIVAHELSHSIDPCGISTGPSDFTFQYPANADQLSAEAAYPWANVLQCLRGPNSVEAKRWPPITVQNYYPTGVYGNYPSGNLGYSVGGKPPSEANPPPKPEAFSFCKTATSFDQVTEAFSDWMAAQVLPKYIKEQYLKDPKNPKLTKEKIRVGYSNVMRSFPCSYSSGDGSFSSHPRTQDRVDRTILVQPEIREQMGCPERHSQHVHCSHDSKSVAPVPMSPTNIPPSIPQTPSTQGAGGTR